MIRETGGFPISKFTKPLSKRDAMNSSRSHLLVISYAFRFWLFIRAVFPRQKCQTFGIQDVKKRPRIDKIFVINLDREPGRWSKMKKELRRVLDSSGSEILDLTERHVAFDANEFIQEPTKDSEIDPFYTLRDQLFVEPQPLTLPTRIELESPIRMSRAECAVARSHIGVWQKFAASNYKYVLILEDDVWFHSGFARDLDRVWEEVVSAEESKNKFDILYLSYLEVKHGAPKTILSRNVFKPVRGLWYLSGYILSRKGASRLLQLLPCRGPIDLWINHQFEELDVVASRLPLIGQRRDIRSTNSYSVLPSLTKIGAITSEGASLFNIRPTEQPVFAFGTDGSGHSSLAMALSMLGYRCCSDLVDLPISEMKRLLDESADKVFTAYVNIGSLYFKIKEIRIRYPKAKFILTSLKGDIEGKPLKNIKDDLKGADVITLHSEELNRWRVICEHLRCAPPACSYPVIKDIGQRPILDEIIETDQNLFNKSKNDNSPWVVESRNWWKGIRLRGITDSRTDGGTFYKITDNLEHLDPNLWTLRSDTFTDNLALFRPSNVKFISGIGAMLSIKRESSGIRNFTAGSLCSQVQYLYGRFEATVKASDVPGVVTGIFLHRNSPRQEIDIEITGNRPSSLLINVFYNPGEEGANYDYGYRGTPIRIDLGFDASKNSHRFAIEWSPCQIRWFVDDKLIHMRDLWNPTPIPHLPMTFHVNSWVTRSTQLAGQIKNRLLPTASIVRKLSLEAYAITSTSADGHQISKVKPLNLTQVI